MLSYLTISKPAEAIYTNKGSKFISAISPAHTLEDVKDKLLALKNEHPKANHICYAYKIDANSKSSDDGEPSGTAGKPILNAILSQNLDYVMIVVIRYFGGTELGIPGLIKAYKAAAMQALQISTKIEIHKMSEVKITFPMERQNIILSKLKNLHISDQKFGYEDSSTMNFKIRTSKIDAIEKLRDDFYDIEVTVF